MGFFSKERPSEMPPLVEAPKGGEPIVFHEEEQQAIHYKKVIEVRNQLLFLSPDAFVCDFE